MKMKMKLKLKVKVIVKLNDLFFFELILNVCERRNGPSFLTAEFPLFAARRFAAVRWIASFRSCSHTFGFAWILI